MPYAQRPSSGFAGRPFDVMSIHFWQMWEDDEEEEEEE